MRPHPQPPSSSRLSKPAYWSRALLAVCAFVLGADTAFAQSTTIVISQVYGAGGNSGATFNRDYVELHNISTSAVTCTNWSIQYASATGSSWTNMTTFSATIQPGAYLLIGQASGANGAALPTVDVSGSIAMAAGAGKVALVNNNTALTGTNPSAGATVVDFVGFGATANGFEGSGPTPAPSATLAVFRGPSGAGTSDTNQNATDFAAATPAPRNSLSPVFPVDTVAPLQASLTPADNATGVGIAAPLSIGFNEAIVKGTGNVSIYLASDTVTPVFTIDVATAAVTTSGQTATIALPGPLVGSTDYFVTVDNGAFKDGANNLFGGISGTTAWSFTTAFVDNTPPVATLSPVDDSTGLPPTSNLVITYNEPILVGAGTILLKTGATTVESIAVPGPRVTVSATFITIDPTAPLSYSTEYSVEVPAGVVTDQALNPSPAIAAGAWTFTTRDQPNVIISQYYEGDGTGTSRYIELKNLTGSPIALDDYRLTSWSPSDPAGNQGWKSGTQTTPRVTTLIGLSIPANGYFLVADSGAANPEYAVVNNDLVVNNTPNPGVTAFSGNQSIVLYSAATNDLANISDAVSFVNTDGANKTFYRLNDDVGFDFTTGSSILDYPTTWTSNKTLADVASAAESDAWYLHASDLADFLTITILPATISEGSVTPATATVTRTGSTAAELDFEITVNDTSEATADAFGTFEIGQSEMTFPITLVNDAYLDGSQIVNVRVVATGFISSTASLTVTDEETDVAFPVVINEVDSDQAGSDTQEFIELYNNSSSPVSLNGATLVLYNGNGNVSYLTIDLSLPFPGEYIIPPHGYFVVGNSAVPNVNITITDGVLQNGADGVALYFTAPVNFPNGTLASTTNGPLIDAVVYNNGQLDGASLATLLTPGESQVNENIELFGLINAIARIPDGGTGLDTSLYDDQAPTPGATNGIGDTFANWIDNYPVGLLNGVDDDFDQDNLDNAIENILGTNPTVFSPGFTTISGTATSVTFQHTLADAPVSNLTPTYEWSTDLATWYPSGPGGGITVVFGPPTVITPGSPSDLIEVTATVTSGTTSQLFARLKVTNP